MPVRILGNFISTSRCRGLALASVVLVAALGCSDQAQPPTAPEATLQPAQAQAVASAAALPFRQLSAGSTHTCGVTTSDRMYCWGDNGSGELGIGNNTGPQICSSRERACSTRPVAVVGGLRFRASTAGAAHTCGVTLDSKAYCWGANGLGVLGDGTNTDRTRPVAVVGGLSFRQLSAGSSHTCGVTTDNRAYCWGSDFFGELGDGTRGDDSPRPVAVTGGLRFRLVSVGSGFTCGLTTTDQAYCWGRNDSGQLGDGTEVEWRFVPTRVTGGRTYRDLDAGGQHTCAVTFGSRAFCWGNGREGQLGTGQAFLSFSPKRVAGGLSFDRVSAGDRHSCGETTGNRLYCWGHNPQGQLGDGTTVDRLAPVAVASSLFFAQVSAGGIHTCARTSANVAYCWGRNLFGGLGDGTEGKRLRPTPVVGPA